jgi:hypothetical protein
MCDCGLARKVLAKTFIGVFPIGVCQELVPRGTRPAYFCLLVPRVQATVSHNDKED